MKPSETAAIGWWRWSRRGRTRWLRVTYKAMEIWACIARIGMADYKEKLDEWQQAARRKARELDEKYSISDLVGEGARAAGEAARRGAETVADSAERLRAEAERLGDEEEVGETARRAASETVKNV